MPSRSPSHIPSSRTASLSSDLGFLRSILAGEILLDGSPEPTGGPSPVVIPSANQPSVAEQVKSALSEILGAKNGNKDEALETLIKRNYALEQRASAAEAKAAKKSDLDELEAWRTLAKEQSWDKPETAKSKYLQAQTEAGEAATLKKQSAMRAACEAAGLDFDDFSTRKGVDELSYEVKTEGTGEAAKKVAHISFEESGQTQTRPLLDWASEKFPSLARAQGEANPRAQGKGAGGSGTGGRPFVQQGVDGGKASVYDRIRENAKADRERAKAPTEDAARRSGLR